MHSPNLILGSIPFTLFSPSFFLFILSRRSFFLLDCYLCRFSRKIGLALTCSTNYSFYGTNSKDGFSWNRDNNGILLVLFNMVAEFVSLYRIIAWIQVVPTSLVHTLNLKGRNLNANCL